MPKILRRIFTLFYCNSNELLDNMIDITDNYLSCPKFSSSCYALYKIDELKKEIIYKDNDNIEEIKKVKNN